MKKTELEDMKENMDKIEGRRKEKRATEDEMVGWHHWLNEHEFE